MEIDIFELQILTRLRTEQAKVRMIPIDIYYNLLAYCEYLEDYSTCIILRDIEDRVSPKTMMEYFDNFLSEPII